ncbi:MAG TPA: glycosyltransferase family 39 protein [Syntrophorhabdaceae bacterium]|nr:glycosyltransferase family 39 protein [Syntrophorhabdaceae bacterium]
MKIIFILFVSGILFINNIGQVALWDPDEPRQAIMAREMSERSDYIHPYLNGRPYLEKPPLYPWLIIITSKITGELNEFSARLPAAVSAILLVLVTYQLGNMVVNPGVGVLSALILATNYQFLSNARESVMDMTFAFFIGLTIFFNYICMLKGKRWLFVISFIPSVFAVLSKGPAGLVIPAMVTFIFMLKRKEFKKYFIPFVAGCIVSLALSSIWFVMAGDAYIKEFILRQNITRYTNAFDHIESFYYYFHKLFVNFMPWSIVLPFSLYHAVKKKIWLPVIWFAFTFLFFEFSKSKRAIYLLSCYPACALICGIYIKDKWSWLVENVTTGVAVKIFALLLTVLPVAAVVFLFTGDSMVIKAFSEQYSLYIYIILLFILGATLFYALIKKSKNLSIVMLFSYLIIMGYFYGAYYMPVMDRTLKSPRLITDHLVGLKESRDIFTTGFSSAGITFYVGKPVQMFVNINEIKDKKRDILLIVEDDQAKNLQKDLDLMFLPVKKTRYENEHYTFYVRKND